MSKKILISNYKPCSLIDLYEAAAKEMGCTDTSEIKYDCTKINVAENIQDGFYEHYLAQIEALTRENITLQEKLDAEKHKRWLNRKDQAITVLFQSVPFTIFQVRKLALDHVDESGYWFSFNVDNDDTRQTYCVRHTDL